MFFFFKEDQIILYFELHCILNKKCNLLSWLQSYQHNNIVSLNILIRYTEFYFKVQISLGQYLIIIPNWYS